MDHINRVNYGIVMFFLALRNNEVYVVYIKKQSTAHALGASVVWHLSLQWLYSFNKTEAKFFHAGYAPWGRSLF